MINICVHNMYFPFICLPIQL